MSSPSPKHSSARSALASLQPVDTEPFQQHAPAWLVWGSLFLVWLASLLPWRLWHQVPDVLLLVLAFWCLHESRRVGLVTAFVLGLLIDVHDSGLLGLNALYYVLAAYGILRLRSRLQHFSAWGQMVHILPVFIVASMLPHLLGAWFNGAWAGWDWFWSALFTGLLWPLADVVLLSYRRRLDDGDAGTV